MIVVLSMGQRSDIGVEDVAKQEFMAARIGRHPGFLTVKMRSMHTGHSSSNGSQLRTTTEPLEPCMTLGSEKGLRGRHHVSRRKGCDCVKSYVEQPLLQTLLLPFEKRVVWD